jgi:hypothetical protein
MSSSSPVEIADQVSRKRAIIVAVAALAFLIIHVVLRPFFYSAHNGNIDWWAVNAVVLLAGLATGGGILNRREIRLLVNDEVARSNYRTAVLAGYWVAMVGAMGVYLVPELGALSARDAIYAIVTSSIVVALLTFSYLELRAHRDA